jgi:hypothetical protein
MTTEILSREGILSQSPILPREELEIPEWGGSIFVRMLSASERDQLEIQWERTKRVHFRARLVYYCACTAEGADLFREEDIPILGAQPTSAVARICDLAFKINKFTKDDVEELEKNSPNGRAADSS